MTSPATPGAIKPLDPDTPKGAQVARELGELLAELTVAVNRREQAEPVHIASAAGRGVRAQGRRAA